MNTIDVMILKAIPYDQKCRVKEAINNARRIELKADILKLLQYIADHAESRITPGMDANQRAVQAMQS